MGRPEEPQLWHEIRADKNEWWYQFSIIAQLQMALNRACFFLA